MDATQFEQARQAVLHSRRAAGGIGTLGEKTLHAVIKHYMDPFEGSHEQKIGRYVADIVGEDGIVEIQTRELYRLRPKLAAFLEVAAVTVVHPVLLSTHLVFLDPLSHRPLRRRKSPRRESFYSAFVELYGIKALLTHPNLRICLLALEVEELRCPDGKKRRGRPTYHKDRVPTALIDRVDIACAADYRKLLPPGLPEAFTSHDFAVWGELHRSEAQAALNVLHHVGAVRQIGKQSRSLLYERAPEGEPAALI